jgi:hypothetical protein
MRGWVCYLQLLPALTSAFILRSKSHRTHDYILLSQIRDSPILEPKSPYLYPQEQGGPVIPPPTQWVPFPLPFPTGRAMVEVILTHLHTLEGQSAMPWCINSRRTEYKHSIADFEDVVILNTVTSSQSQSYIATDGRSINKSLGLMTRSCFCGAPSLTRGRVFLLYMLLVLASAVFLGFEFLGSRDHILLSQFWDFPFRRLLRLAGSRWRYSTPPPHGS